MAIVWLSFLRSCYGKENIGYFGMNTVHPNNGINRRCSRQERTVFIKIGYIEVEAEVRGFII